MASNLDSAMASNLEAMAMASNLLLWWTFMKSSALDEHLPARAVKWCLLGVPQPCQRHNGQHHSKCLKSAPSFKHIQVNQVSKLYYLCVYEIFLSALTSAVSFLIRRPQHQLGSARQRTLHRNRLQTGWLTDGRTDWRTERKGTWGVKDICCGWGFVGHLPTLEIDI